MIVLDCEQGSEQWWEARRGIPTASEFSRIITPKTAKPAAAQRGYIAELLAEVKYAPDEHYGNFWTDRGKFLEAEARSYFGFARDVDVEQVGFVMRDDRRAGCSPDGLINERSAGLELKAPAPKTHIGYLLDGGLPDEYKAQVHAGMAVTGLDVWWFVSYCPLIRPLVIKVERDEFTAQLESVLADFLRRLDEARDEVYAQED